jgi:hypothetical protein
MVDPAAAASLDGRGHGACPCTDDRSTASTVPRRPRRFRPVSCGRASGRGKAEGIPTDRWSEFRTDVVSGLNPISSVFPTFGRLLWLVLLMA